MKLLATAVLAIGLATSAMAEGMVHKVAVHVDQNDPQVLNMALNNVANLKAYYEGIGDSVEVEVVAYGPGLHMFIEGKSPVADRIVDMAMASDDVKFSACGNTIAGMTKKTGQAPVLLEEASVVPSGVARLVELQEQGYSYVRP
ncbi:DsrE family protein [Pseudooceanicola sp. MF1-13]|uniref:DsrE family protein n=1 Tax=Pseudooceanicola sp. MF1-13 TaxID=3379095 RepID=UPI003892AED0